MKYTSNIKKLIFTISILFAFLLVQVVFLSSKSDKSEDINKFATLSKSYNLALSNETIAIRFRNESSINDEFGLSPTSREYFHSTFIYSSNIH